MLGRTASKASLQTIKDLFTAEENYLIETGWIKSTDYVKGKLYWKCPIKGFYHAHGHAVNSQKANDKDTWKKQH